MAGKQAALRPQHRLPGPLIDSLDYPLDHLQPLIVYFSPEKIAQLNLDRFYVVAELNAQGVGTGPLEDKRIWTSFVHPYHQRHGIGARLVSAIESAATCLGLKQLFVQASVAGTPFYERQATVGAWCCGSMSVQL